MRDLLETPRTRRARVASLITGRTVRTAELMASIATCVAAGSLSAIDTATFGLFSGTAADDSCSITSGLKALTSPNNPWTAADVGKAIHVAGAGAAGAVLSTRIATYVGPGSITVEDAASTTVAATKTSAGGLAAWGDDLWETTPLPVGANAAGTQQLAAPRATANGSTTARSMGDRLADVSNVLDAGADRTGVADCSAAFQRAINSSAGDVVVPPGVYRFTAGLTVPNGKRIVGLCGPGGANGNANLVTLRHDYDGDFITFNGSLATNRGAGGGLENLIIEQYNGTSGNPKGKAVVVTGSTVNLRANWVRIRNCQIENASGRDKWTWGIDFDGGTVGGTDGVRDMWVESTRVVGDVTGGGIRIKTAFNVWLIGVECNLTGSDILITGAAAAKSASVFVMGCSADNLDIDWAQLVFVNGGAFTSISTTANSDTVLASPDFLGSIPASLPGSDVLVSAWDEATSRRVVRMAGNTSTMFGRDNGAGDSTNVTQLGVGNTGADEGAIFLRLTNAAAAGGMSMGLVAQPRNNADTTNFSGGELRWDKVGGADQTQAILEWLGSGGLHAITCHQGGYILLPVPVRTAVYTDGTRPSAAAMPAGAMIYNTTDNAPNFSDGANWRDAMGTIT